MLLRLHVAQLHIFGLYFPTPPVLRKAFCSVKAGIKGEGRTVSGIQNQTEKAT